MTATVVRRQVVPQRLSLIATGGVALRIETPSEAYLQLVADHTTAAGPATLRTPSRDAAEPRSSWRVNAKQLGKPRMRTLTLDAIDKESACKEALRKLGDGWEILEVAEA